MVTENTGKGYSKEEEYFYKLNKELIDKKRMEIMAKQSHGARPPNWMKCPKCEGTMVEVELAGIKVDQCGICHGIYFDHGELEILTESKEPKGFIGAMKRVFS